MRRWCLRLPWSAVAGAEHGFMAGGFGVVSEAGGGQGVRSRMSCGGQEMGDVWGSEDAVTVGSADESRGCNERLLRKFEQVHVGRARAGIFFG